MHRICIVTVCYNDLEGLKNTTKSVLEQISEDIEYIIIDGNSCDGTKAYLESLSSQTNVRWISEDDDGIYDAMNKGIGLANAEWIYFLNAGDVLLKGVISKILHNLSNEYDAIYGNVYVSLNYDNKKYFLLESASQNIQLLKKGMICSHQGILFNRCSLSQFGNYDTSFRVAADWDLIARIFKLGGKFKYIDKNFALFDQSGISSKSHLMERHRVRKKNSLYSTLDFWLCKDFLHDVKSKIINILLGNKKNYYAIKIKGYQLLDDNDEPI